MGHNEWEYPGERQRDVKGILEIYKSVAMTKETVRDPNELGIWDWIMYGSRTILDLGIVILYRPN